MTGTTPAKPGLLLLIHRIPYPPDKGDKIRSWHLLQWLSDRFDVSCGFFVDDPEDWQHVDTVKKLCADVLAVPLKPALAKARSLASLLTGEPLGFGYYRDARMAAWVRDRLAHKPAAAIGFSSTMMPYLSDASCPVFADLVDADSAKWRDYAAGAAFPLAALYRREARLLADAEAAISRSVDATFLITLEEAALVEAHPQADRTRIDWYRNGIDTAFFDPDGIFQPLERPVDLIFTGAMDYAPNIAAVTWFIHHCWPSLTERHRDLTLAIVGARPTPAVIALGHEQGVTVTGRVADMRPWLAAARIAIAPLQIARGIQNKVLEAMAMARPVLASAGAASGIEAEPGKHLLIADAREDWIAAIDDLLSDSRKARALGKAARDSVVKTGSWQAQFDRLERKLLQSGVAVSVQDS